MKILSHAFDSELRGRDFAEVLFRHFAWNFKEQYNIDVYSNARAFVSMRAACEKFKIVLSANMEAPLNIEFLMDEKDVRGFIRREEFEKLSYDLLEKISIPCQKALLDSGLPLDNIHNIELVGSCFWPLFVTLCASVGYNVCHCWYNVCHCLIELGGIEKDGTPIFACLCCM
ncbi:heat shock 70 kDa protein 16-like [Ipomoea triloba]|uniref:heat shock 70 kDa protein 16-like n=1 Tax=Ipomoea triloba TaxID=35885 RepID=UPI00125D542D|nr:heat shock 70 kDa protein 16-like [Ipomoea triloba]